MNRSRSIPSPSGPRFGRGITAARGDATQSEPRMRYPLIPHQSKGALPTSHPSASIFMRRPCRRARTRLHEVPGCRTHWSAFSRAAMEGRLHRRLLHRRSSPASRSTPRSAPSQRRSVSRLDRAATSSGSSWVAAVMLWTTDLQVERMAAMPGSGCGPWTARTAGVEEPTTTIAGTMFGATGSSGHFRTMHRRA